MGRITAPFRPPRKVLGADIAGIVEAVGEGVTAFRPGDAVFGDLSEGNWGGLAEFVAAKASALSPIPAGLGFVDAAAIPQAGALALQGLRKGALAPGKSILINGAGGGVGTFAIQLAKGIGARVTAVDRGEKHEVMLALGADRVIEYQQTDFTAEAERYDLILDVVARHGPRRFADRLNDGGHLVVIGGTIPALLKIAIFGGLVGRRRGQSLGLLLYRVSPGDNLELANRCLAGALRPIIDGVYPLERGADALARLGSGGAIGKVMVEVGD
jgi:NADPH:quinone reductase-like Zn-dependent oxidoreductase